MSRLPIHRLERHQTGVFGHSRWSSLRVQVHLCRPLTMADLVKRMNDLEQQAGETAIEQMTLDELAQTKVKIGKTYNGYTFDEMWRSHKSWVKWMLKAYEGSEKPQHKMLHRFVQLKLQQAEANRKTYAPMRAKSKSAVLPPSAVKEEPGEPSFSTEMEEEMEAWEMAEAEGKPEEILHIQSEMVLLSGRMDNMESMLSQILTQILCLQQNQASPGTGDPWNPRSP